MLLYGEKFPAVLPIGLKINGELVREFEVRKVDEVFEEIFTHQTYAARYPQQWSARIASAILKSVGGTDIRSQFRATDYKEIPPIIKSMKVHDLSYVLLCGHVLTHGLQIPAVKYTCNRCTKEGVLPVDLKKMALGDFQERAVKDEVVVDLPTGWKKSVGPKEVGSGVENVLWNRLVFQFPNIQHTLDNEIHYSVRKIAEFNLRIAQSALVSVQSVSAAQNTDEPAVVVKETMNDENLSMYRSRLILDLFGDDKTAIRREFRKNDIVRMEIHDECTCSSELVIPVNTGDLYPLA